MDYYKLWISNKKSDCRCDWCEGHFEALSSGGKADWSHCVWKNSKTYFPGDAVYERDACCAIDKNQTDAISKIETEVSPKTGFNCKLCNYLNEYAEANQSDGTYICFNCK